MGLLSAYSEHGLTFLRVSPCFSVTIRDGLEVTAGDGRQNDRLLISDFHTELVKHEPSRGSLWPAVYCQGRRSAAAQKGEGPVSAVLPFAQRQAGGFGREPWVL